jgi:hypothetical protein
MAIDIRNDMKYMLMKITNSKDGNKKYDAHIANTENGKMTIIPFGNINKRHYRDTTALRTYKHLDHWDLKKREDYINENKKKFEGIKNKFTSDYFTARFLYSIRI